MLSTNQRLAFAKLIEIIVLLPFLLFLLFCLAVHLFNSKLLLQFTFQIAQWLQTSTVYKPHLQNTS